MVGVAQEQFFIPVEGGEEYPRELYRPDESLVVPVVERDLYLIETLDIIARSRGNRGLLHLAQTYAGLEVLKDRYGTNTDAILDGARNAYRQNETQAKWAFAKAIGLSEMESHYPNEVSELRVEAGSEFKKFLGIYRDSSGAVDKSAAYRRTLTDAVDVFVAKDNRESKQRPHKKDSVFKREKQPIPSTIQRLRLIKADPRAGFIPTTHKEKILVLTWLDYLDNPEYPLGINDQLNEVFTHAQKVSRINAPGDKTALRGATSGKRSIESIAYEVVDYYNAAREQGKALEDLELLIADCPNPHVTLLEEVGDNHPGFAPLVRFIDLNHLIETDAGTRGRGGLSVPKNPLKVREHRWAKGGEPGRHKVVEDEYTATEVDPFYEERIAKRVRELTIGELRSVVKEAITDQKLREEFMKCRLQDFELASERRSQKIVRDVAHEALAAASATTA